MSRYFLVRCKKELLTHLDFPEQANCTNGEVRLVGGSSPHEGRIEICVNDVWGTVCSNSWSTSDSNVVCGQLGYLPIGLIILQQQYHTFNLGGRGKSNAYFGLGTGPILLSNLYCTGTESSLLECNQQSCYATSCTHGSDVGVICERKI